MQPRNPDCPDYPRGCPWPGQATPRHCTFETYDIPSDEDINAQMFENRMSRE